MNNNKHKNISDELNKQTQPSIEYLVQNYKDPNKLNSCLDVASENIRMLEALVHQAESRLKDFKALKKLTLIQEQKRQNTKAKSKSEPTPLD